MTRLASFIRSRSALGLAGLAAITGVLYGIYALTVHAPPRALARLHRLDTPIPAPDVHYFDENGRRQSFQALHGRLVLVNLWATWCAPCVRELPALARLSQEMSDRQVVVVAIDVGRDDARAAKAFLSRHGAARLGVYLDSDTTMLRGFHAFGLPTSILLDGKGRMIARVVGPADWDDPEAVAYLRRMANGV
jgi:thiol-disulfide isomerase/thioredoxin